MYNPNAITIFYKKPVNYNISPRRGMRRDIGCTHADNLEQLPAKIAEVNSWPGCSVIEAVTMGGKRVNI